MYTGIINGGSIQTVTGVLLPKNLGWCQCHEHLFIAKGKSFEINPALFMNEVDKSAVELFTYMNSGGLSLVDAQPLGCGRMAGHLLEASKAAGVNIIASTGFHKLQFYNNDHWINTIEEDRLSELFIAEIENGMYIDGDNDIPSRKVNANAGIIKIAIDSIGLKGRYETLFCSVANASLETGAPILCHVEQGSDPFEVIKFFTSRGIRSSSLILCHLDRVEYDLAFHKEIAETGVYLEYDTIGRFKYHSDEKEAELISGMVEAGFEDRILLGLDTTRERLKSYGGSIGLDYINTVFVPKLISMGIDRKITEKFGIKNPQGALAIDKS